MSTKSAFIVFAMVITIMAMVFVGCEGEQGPQGPSGTGSIYIIGEVRTNSYWGTVDTTGSVDIWISGSEGIPIVTVNEIPIPFNFGSVPLRFTEWNFHIYASDQVRLVVTEGNTTVASSTTMMPGSFEITSPDTIADVVSIGDTLLLQWSVSQDAEIYHLDVFSSVMYSDTSGGFDFHWFNFYCDTLTTETEMSFPPILFFPDSIQINQFNNGLLKVQLYAISGPLSPGDPGNISGNGTGVLNGYSYTSEYEFQWQLPSP
jgi:hypothetical protein